MRKLIYLSFAIGIGLSSCSKDKSSDSLDPTKSTATSMHDVKIPANFDWKTTHTVTITVPSAPVYSDEIRQMKVKSMDGKLLSTHSVRMTEDATISFNLPKSMQTVIVEYGSIIREVRVANGNGVFSYVDEPDATTNDSEEPQFDEKELEPFIEE